MHDAIVDKVKKVLSLDGIGTKETETEIDLLIYDIYKLDETMISEIENLE